MTKQPTLSGTTLECKEHFQNACGSPTAALHAYRKKYPGESNSTVYDWFARDKMPMADRLIRLQTFLQENGYKILELQNVPEKINRLRIAIAKKYLSKTDVEKEMNFSRGVTMRFLEGKVTVLNRKKSGVFEKMLQRISDHTKEPQTNVMMTKEAFVHYINSVGSEDATDEVMDWFQKKDPNDRIARRTSIRWFSEKKLPAGVRMIRIQAFLSERGYHLQELEKLSGAIILLRKAVVEGRITAEEIQQRMQYSSMCWTLQLIYGKTEPKGEFRERFEKILAELKQPDSSAHMSVADAEALDERYAPRTLTPKLVSSNGAALGSTGKEELKKLIVVHVKAMLPLMELAASDSFTPEDREQIRTEVGAFPFFEFTNALIQLSGERARGQNISSSNSKRRS